jgi:hypothetical protein
MDEEKINVIDDITNITYTNLMSDFGFTKLDKKKDYINI